MYTLQASNLNARLIEAGLPQEAVDALIGVVGNCTQEIEHRGPVTFNVDLPPSASQAALTVDVSGNYPAGSNPQTATNGNPNTTDQLVPAGQFNPNGPAAAQFNGIVRQNGPFVLNGPMVLGNKGNLPAPSSATVAAHSIGDVKCGIVLDASGRVIGGYNGAGTWYSPWSVADPGLVGTNS